MMYRSGISIVAMMFGSFFMATPLGLPPMPEDARISASAPPECVWYYQSNGMATADPSSENQTEQLIAEPEVQNCFKNIEKIITEVMVQNARDEKTRALAKAGPLFLKSIATRPMALYLSDIAVPEKRNAPPLFHAGAIIHLDNAAEIQKWLLEIPELTGETPKSMQTENATWNAFPWHVPVPAHWTIQEDYLLIAVGEGEAARLYKRFTAQGSEPAWLAKIKKKLAVERTSTVSYINVGTLVDTFGPMMGRDRSFLTTLGLDNVDSIYTVSGLDKESSLSRMQLEIRGTPEGIFALLPSDPLSKSDLGFIPGDATASFSIRLDAEELIAGILDLVEEFEPGSRAEFEHNLEQASRMLGIDPQEDLIQTLDDVWTIYVPDGDITSSWIRSTAVVKVKDPETLDKSLEKLAFMFQMEMLRGRRRRSPAAGPILRKKKYQGRTIHFLSIPERDFPFAPAWCVTEDKLIIGLLPQTVQDFLLIQKQQEADDSAKPLVKKTEFADAMEAGDGAASILYVDTKKVTKAVYPWLQFGFRMLCTNLQREGIDIDASLLPPMEAILPHMQPSTVTWSQNGDGYLLESRQTVPLGGNFVSSTPVMVALLLPAVQSARNAAREAQEMNILKQFALAAMNCHDVYKRFPSNIYDKKGKALLSWRVQLLPYMEENALYDEFHLDEPWDSKHNKKLIAQMPAIFRAPTSPVAPGKTCFLALAGKETMFPGNKKISFRDISDGSSRTLLFVRANSQNAVIWTKPDDIAFDAKKPLNGLHNPKGYFLAVFCDGHVDRISTFGKNAAELIKAYATRAGGEDIRKLERTQFGGVPEVPRGR